MEAQQMSDVKNGSIDYAIAQIEKRFAPEIEQLRKERDEARMDYEAVRDVANQADTMMKQRDEARGELFRAQDRAGVWERAADAARAEIVAAHECIDEAGGIPNRDSKIGELTLLQRIRMLADDLGVYERARERLINGLREWCAQLREPVEGYDGSFMASGPGSWIAAEVERRFLPLSPTPTREGGE